MLTGCLMAAVSTAVKKAWGRDGGRALASNNNHTVKMLSAKSGLKVLLFTECFWEKISYVSSQTSVRFTFCGMGSCVHINQSCFMCEREKWI